MSKPFSVGTRFSVDGIIIDYYTQALNLAPTEKSFDMDYFGSMLMHFAPEDSAQ